MLAATNRFQSLPLQPVHRYPGQLRSPLPFTFCSWLFAFLLLFHLYDIGNIADRIGIFTSRSASSVKPTGRARGGIRDLLYIQSQHEGQNLITDHLSGNQNRKTGRVGMTKVVETMTRPSFICRCISPLSIRGIRTGCRSVP